MTRRLAPSRPHLAVACGILTSSVAFFSCSGGDDGADPDSALSAVNAAVAEQAAEWAAAAAAAYSEELEVGGSLDAIVVQPKFEAATRTLVQFICGALEESSTLRDGADIDDVSLSVSRLVDEAAARAIARDGKLLAAIGLNTTDSLPVFMLSGPGQPGSPIGEGNDFSGLVKPAFLDAKRGGIVLPEPADAAYVDFQRWLYDPKLDNRLLEKASATSKIVRGNVDDCLA